MQFLSGITVNASILRIQFAICFHFGHRRQLLPAVPIFERESYLNVHHLCVSGGKCQSDQCHCWIVDVDDMLKEWLHAIVVNVQSTIDTHEWKCHFIAGAIDNRINVIELFSVRCYYSMLSELFYRTDAVNIGRILIDPIVCVMTEINTFGCSR